MATDNENHNEIDIDGRTYNKASGNIWYALATIEGEPKRAGDVSLVNKNRFYWNGYMRLLIGEKKYKTAQLPSKIGFELPKLGKNDIGFVNTRLTSLGFDVNDLQNDTIDFSLLYLPLCHFENFVFLKKVDFYRTKFSRWVYFKDSVFYRDAIFAKSVFDEWSDFLNSKFCGSAIFDDCTFNQSVSFKQATFSRGVFFSGADFVERVDFREAKFFVELDFGPGESDKKTTFRSNPPEFFNANTPENVRWSDVKFPASRGISRSIAIKHKDAYERLGLMMDKLNKHHDKHMFFRLEMRTRRQMEKIPLTRSINWAYEFLSDYGLSLIHI